MSQQSFSRPGAVDLSALKQPAPGQSAGPAGAGGAAGGTAYSVTVDQQNFQSVIEQSQTAPVLLVFFSRTQSPDSGRLADDLVTVVDEHEGRYLLGRVDVDANPEIGQAMQIPQVPLVVAVVDGRPMPLLQEAVGIDELRTALTQVAQQLTQQGVTGRHQPRGGAVAEEGEAEDDEPTTDPRFAAAEQALADNDLDGAVAEYKKLLDANPADTEASVGLARARLYQRTQEADLAAAREAAAQRPDDVAAQTLCADMDLLGGHVEDAFNRLIELVRRSAGDERTAAREHLLDLFAVVGNEDERVARGRQALASALF